MAKKLSPHRPAECEDRHFPGSELMGFRPTSQMVSFHILGFRSTAKEHGHNVSSKYWHDSFGSGSGFPGDVAARTLCNQCNT